MPKIEPSPEMVAAMNEAAEALEARERRKLRKGPLPGWICPVCGAGVSPDVAVCPNPHQPQRGTQAGATIKTR